MTTDNPTPEQPEPAQPPAEVPPEAARQPTESAVPETPLEPASAPTLTAETAEPTPTPTAEAAEPTPTEETAEPTPTEETAEPTPEEPAPAPERTNLEWYVVKVQSGREESIKEAIERRVKIDNLQESFGQIVIPTEKVSEMRKNKRYIRERKLLPGYLMVQVEFNEHMLYLFRETSGVGDFVGGSGLGKKPIPMSEREVQKWIKPADGAAPTSKVEAASPFNEGDRVKVKDGMFAGMEGVVKQILEAKGAVSVELTIFGRPVPVELEYWQVDFE